MTATMTPAFAFSIPGTPQQQGSKDAHHSRGTGKSWVSESNKKLKPWRHDAIIAGQVARAGAPPIAGPVTVIAEFVFPRPASHYGSGKNAGVVKSSAPLYKPTRPDVCKLSRAIHDVLKLAGILVDDSQIVVASQVKRFADPQEGPHVKVIVSTQP